MGDGGGEIEIESTTELQRINFRLTYFVSSYRKLLLIVFRIPFATNHVHRRDLKVSEPCLSSFGRIHGLINTSTDVVVNGGRIFDQRPYVEM